MIGLLMSFASSRLGLAAIALAAALSWHYVDKAAAVRSAEQELADKVELRLLETELETIKEQAEKAQQANEKLAEEITKASEAAEDAQRELEEYEASTAVNSDGVVDRALLERLRNR